MLEKIDTTKKLEPLRAPTEEYDEQDIPLSPGESDRYTGMLSKSVGFEVDSIQTQGELEGASEYAQEQLIERQKEDTVDIVEQMVRQGKMSPEEIYQYATKRKPVITKAPVEAYYVQQNMDKTLTNDDTQGSALSDDPRRQYEFARVSTNRQILASKGEELRGSYNRFSPQRIATVWFTPVEAYRRNPQSIVTSSLSLSKTKKEEQRYIREKMLTLSPDEYSEWLSSFCDRYITAGGNPDILADMLEEANTLHKEGWGSDIWTGIDYVSLGVPTSKIVKGAASVGKTGVKTAAKEVAKGFVEVAGEVVPFADVPIKVVAKSLGDVASGTGKVVKAGIENAPKNAIKNDKAFLNRRSADENLASAIKSDDPKIFEDPAVSEENVHTAMSPRVSAEDTAPVHKMPQTEEANQSQEALRRTVEQLNTRGYSLEKLEEEALEAEVNLWRANHPNFSSNIGDLVDVEFVDLADDKIVARFILGNGEGLHNPFTTKKSAETFAKTLPRKDVSNIRVVNDGAGYWVWAEAKLDKSRGVIVDDFLNPASGKNGKFTGGLWGYMTQTASIPTSTMRLGNLVQKQSGDILNLLKGAEESWKALNKGERESVEYLVKQSRIKGAFLTETALKEAGYSEKVIKAYQNMRLVNDIEYIAKQRALVNSMQADGLKRITVYPNKKTADGIVTGRLINPDTFSEERYFFVEEADAARTPFKLTRKQYKDRYKDYEIVEYLYSTDNIPATKAYHLVPKKTLVVKDLDANFSSYIPGFSNVYDNKATFIKQLKTTVLPDGEEVPLRVSTLFGEGNRRVALLYAKELENIRKAVTNFEAGSTQFTSKAALDKYIVNNSPIGRWSSSQDFKKFAEDHNISLNPKDTIEAVNHGEVLKSLDLYRRTIDEDSLKALDKQDVYDFAARQAGVLSRGKIDKAARRTSYEKPLTDINGNRTPYIDAHEELRNSLRNIENVTTWDNYSKLFADNYGRLFKDVLPPNMSPAKALSTGSLVGMNERNVHMINAARKAKRTHDYMRGIMTHSDVTIANFFSRVLSGIGERFDFLKDLPLVGDAFVEGANLQRKIATLAPVKYLRWGVTHMYLGMCNVRQLYTQALSAVHTVEISPVAGIKAIPLAFIMGPLITKTDKAALKAAGKALTKAGIEGMSDSWLSKFIQVAKKLDVYGRSARGGAVDVAKEAVKTKVDRLSLAPYLWGEGYNRNHAVATTILEELQKGTTLDDLLKMDSKTQSLLLTRQNHLYMNMNKTGVAPVQQGNLLSVALQMKGFQMRYIESFFNRDLTKAEKLRMAIGDIILTGFGGWTGVNTYKWWDQDREKDSFEKFAIQAFEEGFINTIMSQYFGSNIDWSEPMSVGMSDLIEGMWNLDTGAIPVSGVFKKWGKGFDIVYNHFQNYKYDSLTPKRFKELVNKLATRRTFPSGMNNAVLGWQIATTGNLYASNGLLTASDLDKTEAVAIGLGLKHLNETQVYKLNSIRYDQKAKIEEAYKYLRPEFNDMLNNNSPDARDYFHNIMMQTFDRYGITDLSEKQEVWEKLRRGGKHSLKDDAYDRFVIGVLKDSGVESAIITDNNYRR